MRRRQVLALSLLGGATGGTAWAQAGAGEPLPGYRRVEGLAGTVKAAGSSIVAGLLKPLSERFSQLQPGVGFDIAGAGSATALAGMLAAPDTLGLFSRPMNAKERERLRDQHGQAPLELAVAVDAVAIYVFKDNPAKVLSVADLQRAFGRTAGTEVLTWGALGQAGAWAGVPLVRYGLEPGRGAHEVLRELVLKGQDFHADIAVEPVSTSVVQGVATQPGGIGYASVFFRTTRTRVLPLLHEGQPVEPSAENAAAGRYPLARKLYVCWQRQAGPTGALQRQFLRFLLSRDAQELMARLGVYPVDAALARQGLQQLEV